MEWFRHDVNMENDSAIQILMLRHKLEGLGAYIHVVHLLYEGDGHVEKDRLLRNLRMYSSNADEIYQTLIDEGLLTEADGVVTSNRVVAEIEFDAERRKRFSEMGKASARARADAVAQRRLNIGLTAVQQTHNGCSTPYQTIPNHNRDTYIAEEGEILSDPSGARNISSPSSIKETAAFQGVRAHNAIADYQAKFNAIEGVVKCTRLTVEREMAVDAILRHFTVEEIDRTFEKIAQSTFLRGDNRKGFKITFDWLFQIDNFTKVLEGNYGNYDSYDNGKKAATTQRTNKMIEDPEERKRMNQYDPRTGRPLTPEEIAEKERRIREEEEDFERRMKARRGKT